MSRIKSNSVSNVKQVLISAQARLSTLSLLKHQYQESNSDTSLVDIEIKNVELSISKLKTNLLIRGENYEL